MFHSKKIFSLDVVSGTVSGFADYLLTTKFNKSVIVTALSMNEFMQITHKTLKKIDFLTPDGMPMVWLMKMIDSSSERVYGPDLMEEILKKTANDDKTHFFYGSTNDVLKKLINKIKKIYPEMKIVGSISPPFSDLLKNEENKLFSKIEKERPDFIWIGLGGKKQAETSLRLREFLSYGARIMPVGAAFDFISGNKDQAPNHIQRAGLEWLFRLLKEPKRLWKRYLLQIPGFLVLWFLEATRILFSRKK